MQVIYKPRGTGKSTDLIKLSVETNSYILVKDRKRALDLSKMASDLGYPQMLFPITLTEYMANKMKGSHVKTILIDDADDILQAIFNTVTIQAITLTKE